MHKRLLQKKAAVWQLRHICVFMLNRTLFTEPESCIQGFAPLCQPAYCNRTE